MEGRWHILRSLHNSDDSLEEKKKKKQGRGDLHEEREGLVLVLVSIYGLSMYLSVVSTPIPCWKFTLNERSVANRRKCSSLSLSRDAASHLRQAGRCLSHPLICLYICTVHLTNTPSCRPESRTLSPNAFLQHCGAAIRLSKNSLFHSLANAAWVHTSLMMTAVCSSAFHAIILCRV